MDILALLFSFLLWVLFTGGIVYLAVRLALKRHDRERKESDDSR